MRSLPSLPELALRFPAIRGLGVRRAVPFVPQMSATECGAACLAMVLRYHGRTVPLEELRDIAVSSRDATNAQALIETGRLYGLRGRAVALEIDQMKYLERGAILHWDFAHFVVLDRVMRDGLQIVDPKQGRRRVTLDHASSSFTGVAILFEPDESFHGGEPKKRGTVRRYVEQVLTERAFVPHILAASVLLQAVGLGVPLLTRLIIDRVVPYQDHGLLWLLTLGMAIVLLFQALTSNVRSQLLLYLRARLDLRMTLGFLDHLLTLPFEFFQRRSTGDLLVRVQSNAVVREMLTGTLLSTILDGALAAGYLILLLAISPPIAMLATGLASVQIVLFLITRNRQRNLIAESLDAQAKSQGYMVEMLAGVESLKASGAEQRATDRWSAFFASELNVSLKRGKLDAWVQAVTGVVRGASSMTLLAVGALQVMRGTISLGDMMALMAIANGFIGPLLSLAAAGTQLQLMGVYLERLNDVLDTEPERRRTRTRSIERLSGGLCVKDVRFRYGPISPLVLDRVSAKIHAGEFVAIVGPSGSGKSTLARLMVGLYQPLDGAVFYDDIDVRDVDVTALRRQIGVVTQQPHLFGGSIRSNIAFADPSMVLDRVIAAAKLAAIHDDIIAMPMGYDTILIDRGGSLSGGQQQRVSLARALVNSPRILLLDEATSQLDATTERQVRDCIASLGCTRIVIAHRLSTIRYADRIFVLNEGRLAEQGCHEELLSQGGLYASLVAEQMASPSDIDVTEPT